EATAAAVTDVEYPLELAIERGGVVEGFAAPVERMPRRRLETAFPCAGAGRCSAHEGINRSCARRRARGPRAPRGGGSAHRRQSSASLSDAVQGLLEPIGVRALGLRERFEPVGDFTETFLARALRHSRIHVGVLVRLTGDRSLQVQARLTDRQAG